MFFKNLQIYRLPEIWDIGRDQLEAQLAAQFPQTKKRGCTPAAYLVRMPGKPPVIRKSERAATDAALSVARRRKRADVYALVPIGTARPGAEWSDAK